jgi:hypothetical protein
MGLVFLLVYLKARNAELFVSETLSEEHRIITFCPLVAFVLSFLMTNMIKKNLVLETQKTNTNVRICIHSIPSLRLKIVKLLFCKT